VPEVLRSKYILDPSIFEIGDYKTKYMLIAARALAEENITVLISANPSTFLKIHEVINDSASLLIQCVETGDVSVLGLNNQQYGFTPSTRRAAILRTLVKEKGILNFSDVWPHVKCVATWMSGNCAILIPKLKRLLSPQTLVVDAGYLSSEFRGTITIDCNKNLGLPTIQDNFFEFIERDSYDNGLRETITLDKVEHGKQYYILVTALHGLYRYFINDIIKVTGKYNNTPTISFVQKGKGVTTLTGEKLYESQVIAAVETVIATLNIPLEFYLLIADCKSFSYCIYVESKVDFDADLFSIQLDQSLSTANIEYDAKRRSGRINPLVTKKLKIGTQELFKSYSVQYGQREGQLKTIRLQYKHDVLFNFDDHVD
jgi:hypothetical protein